MPIWNIHITFIRICEACTHGYFIWLPVLNVVCKNGDFEKDIFLQMIKKS